MAWGMMAGEGWEAVLLPRLFVAVTVNEYDVPLVSWPIMADVPDVTVIGDKGLAGADATV
jgi:hypothetical protein